MVKVLVGIIRLYQRWLSPWLGQNCRFYPSCSQYAIDALQAHGVVYGLLLGAWRILRCNPFCRGGHDPVPEKRHGH